MSIPSTQKCQILAIILKIYWSTQLFPVLVLVQLTNDSKRLIKLLRSALTYPSKSVVSFVSHMDQS